MKKLVIRLDGNVSLKIRNTESNQTKLLDKSGNLNFSQKDDVVEISTKQSQSNVQGSGNIIVSGISGSYVNINIGGKKLDIPEEATLLIPENYLLGLAIDIVLKDKARIDLDLLIFDKVKIVAGDSASADLKFGICGSFASISAEANGNAMINIKHLGQATLDIKTTGQGKVNFDDGDIKVEGDTWTFN